MSLSDGKISRLVSLAKKHIHKSNYKYKLVAIIYSKNKIISIGVNSNTKDYPWLKRFFIHSSLHAEIAALVSILHYDDLKNLDMFVYRESVCDGSVRNAKSCPMCVQAMYSTGWFRKISWTTDNGTVETAKIEDLYKEVKQMDKDLVFTLNGKRIKR